jgi:hypothetical protein
MKGKWRTAVFLALALALVVNSVVYAETDTPPTRIRVVGEITGVDKQSSMFSLRSSGGEAYRFEVDRFTQFRSPNGTVRDLNDLDIGMHALVVGLKQENGTLLARLVAAGEVDKEREIIRSKGEIIDVDVIAETFSLRRPDGTVLTFQIGERTKYRSRDGSIKGLEDLKPGMFALVVGVKLEDGSVLALLVAAGEMKDKPVIKQFRGEIAGVVPGQGTFSLLGLDGEMRTFETIDRTVFRSRDGEIKDIHDLKKGMKAMVGAVEKEDGTLIALVVGVWKEKDPPGDIVSAAGRIVVIGKHEFTIEKRDGRHMIFSVDGSTIYKSRDGSVTEFDDLELGMVAVVRARRLGNDKLKAFWVGAGWLTSDRPINPDDQGSHDAPARPPIQDSVLPGILNS